MTQASPALKSLGCPYHMNASPDCLYCRQHAEFEASRSWKCLYCDSGDKRLNEVAGKVWCGACGKEAPNATL